MPSCFGTRHCWSISVEATEPIPDQICDCGKEKYSKENFTLKGVTGRCTCGRPWDDHKDHTKFSELFITGSCP